MCFVYPVQPLGALRELRAMSSAPACSVSVIVPVYNLAPFLEETFQSVTAGEALVVARRSSLRVALIFGC